MYTEGQIWAYVPEGWLFPVDDYYANELLEQMLESQPDVIFFFTDTSCI